jgi:hypothetical protein
LGTVETAGVIGQFKGSWQEGSVKNSAHRGELRHARSYIPSLLTFDDLSRAFSR